jgi:exodeoxyribonuclease VII large subunit
MVKNIHIYTVSELTRRIKIVLDGAFAQVWVQGEISNFSCSSAGHMYFSLKDEKSELSAALFRGAGRNLKFELKNGMEVIVFGRISLYEVKGRCQLYVDKIEPQGIGALQQAFEQLKERLAKEGLFDRRHKQPLPFLPRRIGVVTSPTGAAIRDILHVLDRRFGNLEIILNPVKVQGEGSSGEIARAIEEFNRFGGVDVLIVGRGGGSLEDLWAFNKEEVARAIFRSRIPVVSAVGHEIDYTIADFVADFRAPTPSAAAEQVIMQKQELLDGVNNLYSRAGRAVSHRITLLQDRYSRMKERYAFRQPADLIQQYQQMIDRLVSTLNLKVSHSAEISRERCNVLIGKLQALSPLNILSRGYSITLRLPEKEAVKNASALNPGAEVQTRLAEGSFVSRVEKILERYEDGGNEI